MQCAARDGEDRAGVREVDRAGFEVDERHRRSSWGGLRVLMGTREGKPPCNFIVLAVLLVMRVKVSLCGV